MASAPVVGPRVFIAGPWETRVLLRDVWRPKLEATGASVVSRWLDQDGAYADVDHVERARRGNNDVDDAMNADIFVVSCPPDQPTFGRGVEFGIAVVQQARIIIVGPRSHVYHYIDEVWDAVATIDEAAALVRDWSRKL